MLYLMLFQTNKQVDRNLQIWKKCQSVQSCLKSHPLWVTLYCIYIELYTLSSFCCYIWSGLGSDFHRIMVYLLFNYSNYPELSYCYMLIDHCSVILCRFRKFPKTENLNHDESCGVFLDTPFIYWIGEKHTFLIWIQDLFMFLSSQLCSFSISNLLLNLFYIFRNRKLSF